MVSLLNCIQSSDHTVFNKLPTTFVFTTPISSEIFPMQTLWHLSTDLSSLHYIIIFWVSGLPKASSFVFKILALIDTLFVLWYGNHFLVASSTPSCYDFLNFLVFILLFSNATLNTFPNCPTVDLLRFLPRHTSHCILLPLHIHIQNHFLLQAWSC